MSITGFYTKITAIQCIKRSGMGYGFRCRAVGSSGIWLLEYPLIAAKASVYNIGFSKINPTFVVPFNQKVYILT